MLNSVIHRPGIRYPLKENFFSPSSRYPEYCFDHFSPEPNEVYQAVRDCFIQAGLDAAHISTKQWNPLGDYIKKSSNVFVLCNFVYHRRAKESDDDFFAKCTHGSVVRAMLDYVLIAVGERGRVLFGNAPLQSCDWNRVLQDTGVDKVYEFYKNFSKVKVEPKDLRLYVTKRNSLGTIQEVEERDASGNYVEVDLKNDSLLEAFYLNSSVPRFRVSDYDSELTQHYHSCGKHIYVIAKDMVLADTLISIPKLKTHEKVGITCGLKGCVGAIARKECLAHHRFGSPALGGDEYPQKLFFLPLASRFHDLVNKRSVGVFDNVLRVIDKSIRRLLRLLGFNAAGNWHGNDTAWRMTLDIARILSYVSKKGCLLKTEMRPHLVLTDGIIGGEGEGPLSPRPIKSASVSFADNIVAADYINALLMGLNAEKISLIKNAFTLRKYTLINTQKEIIVEFNGEKIAPQHIAQQMKHKFKSPKGWRNL